MSLPVQLVACIGDPAGHLHLCSTCSRYARRRRTTPERDAHTPAVIDLQFPSRSERPSVRPCVEICCREGRAGAKPGWPGSGSSASGRGGSRASRSPGGTSKSTGASSSRTSDRRRIVDPSDLTQPKNQLDATTRCISRPPRVCPAYHPEITLVHTTTVNVLSCIYLVPNEMSSKL